MVFQILERKDLLFNSVLQLDTHMGKTNVIILPLIMYKKKLHIN